MGNIIGPLRHQRMSENDEWKICLDKSVFILNMWLDTTSVHAYTTKSNGYVSTLAFTLHVESLTELRIQEWCLLPH